MWYVKTWTNWKKVTSIKIETVIFEIFHCSSLFLPIYPMNLGLFKIDGFCTPTCTRRRSFRFFKMPKKPTRIWGTSISHFVKARMPFSLRISQLDLKGSFPSQITFFVIDEWWFYCYLPNPNSYRLICKKIIYE